MRFFIPAVKPADYETHYASRVASVKDQMRWTITPRRIYCLEYTHDKQQFELKVGEIENAGRDYEVEAILESNSYVVLARDILGGPGLTIMVDKSEITHIEDFEAAPAS